MSLWIQLAGYVESGFANILWSSLSNASSATEVEDGVTSLNSCRLCFGIDFGTLQDCVLDDTRERG